MSRSRKLIFLSESTSTIVTTKTIKQPQLLNDLAVYNKQVTGFRFRTALALAYSNH